MIRSMSRLASAFPPILFTIINLERNHIGAACRFFSVLPPTATQASGAVTLIYTGAVILAKRQPA